VRWVPLVDVDPTAATPRFLIQTVAEACGIRDFSAGTSWDALIACLSDHRHLLILDNTDRIIDAVGALVSELLAAVPTLRILATSRQPLGLRR